MTDTAPCTALLLLLVDDIMHKGEQVPIVKVGTPIRDALLEITRKGLGMTTVVDANGNWAATPTTALPDGLNALS